MKIDDEILYSEIDRLQDLLESMTIKMEDWQSKACMYKGRCEALQVTLDKSSKATIGIVLRHSIT